MVSSGVNQNGSQFYITLGPCPHMDGRCVAFGRVVSGMSVVEKISKVYSMKGRPASDVFVKKAGLVEPKK